MSRSTLAFVLGLIMSFGSGLNIMLALHNLESEFSMLSWSAAVFAGGLSFALLSRSLED